MVELGFSREPTPRSMASRYADDPLGSRPENEEWGVSSWAATRSVGREPSCVKVVIPYFPELEELESCNNATTALFDC